MVGLCDLGLFQPRLKRYGSGPAEMPALLETRHSTWTSQEALGTYVYTAELPPFWHGRAQHNSSGMCFQALEALMLVLCLILVGVCSAVYRGCFIALLCLSVSRRLGSLMSVYFGKVSVGKEGPGFLTQGIFSFIAKLLRSKCLNSG